MKYALVNGTKQEATPKQHGICICCNGQVVSKCGNNKIWHWSHKSLDDCDNWWESETPWHRAWKDYFPVENQEVVHFDEVTGEKHIADVKNNNGIVIEFQNSPINEQELLSRERFYRKMLWIVNGAKFRENFKIRDDILPNPNCDFFADIVFWVHKPPDAKYKGLLYHRKSDVRDGCIVTSGSQEDLTQQIEDNYIGHHLFHWKNKREVWFIAKKPVYIDFGDNNLWQLKKYYEDPVFWCVQKFCKKAVINEYGGTY